MVPSNVDYEMYCFLVVVWTSSLSCYVVIAIADVSDFKEANTRSFEMVSHLNSLAGSTYSGFLVLYLLIKFQGPQDR